MANESCGLLIWRMPLCRVYKCITICAAFPGLIIFNTEYMIIIMAVTWLCSIDNFPLLPKQRMYAQNKPPKRRCEKGLCCCLELLCHEITSQLLTFCTLSILKQEKCSKVSPWLQALEYAVAAHKEHMAPCTTTLPSVHRPTVIYGHSESRPLQKWNQVGKWHDMHNFSCFKSQNFYILLFSLIDSNCAAACWVQEHFLESWFHYNCMSAEMELNTGKLSNSESSNRIWKTQMRCSINIWNFEYLHTTKNIWLRNVADYFMPKNFLNGNVT